ncbi:MAG: hypothetical protein KKC46_14575 [Proteobacteria bacterium]|nr:hypothetical protein [Pseudomonadota bacterium]
MNENPQTELKEHQNISCDDEIDLMDCLLVLWRRKVLIILMTILITGVAIGTAMLRYPAKYVTSCAISLDYPGIEENKNPDNTMFAKEQIITPDIIARATSFLQKSNKSFSEIDLRAMIDIESIIPYEIQEKMKKAEIKKESYSFYPNRFTLTFTQEKDGILSNKEREEILLSIINQYKKDFEIKYGQEPLVMMKFPDNFLKNSDYIDVVNTFKTKTDDFIKFLNSKIAKAGFFRSKKTGESFIELKSSIELLNNIEISQIEATIHTLQLSKNKKNLINLYKQKIKTIEVKRKKREKEALVAKELLKYIKQAEGYTAPKSVGNDKGETRLVLDTSFIKSLVKEDSSSFLIKTALEAEVDAKKMEVDKEYLQEEIVCLKEKEKEKEKENITYLQENLKNISERIFILSKKANDLNMEYLSTLVSNAVNIVRYPETNKIRAVNIRKIALLFGVMALLISIFIAFFIEYIKNVKHKSQFQNAKNFAS